MSAQSEFVGSLARRLRERLPLPALLYLGSDDRAQEGLRGFARDVEDGLALVAARAKKIDDLIVELRARKTAVMSVLQGHHKSIEEVLRLAIQEVEAEGRRLS